MVYHFCLWYSFLEDFLALSLQESPYLTQLYRNWNAVIISLGEFLKLLMNFLWK